MVSRIKNLNAQLAQIEKKHERIAKLRDQLLFQRTTLKELESAIGMEEKSLEELRQETKAAFNEILG